MKTSGFWRYVISVYSSAAMLVGCSGPQLPTAPHAMAQTLAFSADADPGQSWMFSNTSNEDLLYVAGSRDLNRVYVFAYPGGQHVGTLGGLADPSAVCVDASQNVWISSSDPNVMIEFAHGKARRRATLSDGYGDAVSCSVDPKTGNLAVANLFGSNGYGSNIIVFAKAQGNATVYSVTNMEYVWGCAYDSSGNLFASGEVYNSDTHVAELAAGGSQFENLTIGASLGETASGLQWDGKYLDLAIGTGIDRLVISGSTASIKGTLNLIDADNEWAFNFFVDGSTVISHVQPILGAVGLWSYPRGGSPKQIIPNARGEKAGFDENGIAVSKATQR